MRRRLPGPRRPITRGRRPPRRGRDMGRGRRFPWVKLLLVLLVGLLLLGAGVLFVDARMKPYVSTVAQYTARAIATRAISDAVTSTISERGIEYDDLVSLEKDLDGRISAIKTNIVKLNQLKAGLNQTILDELVQLEQSTIGVPLGNIIGGDIFAGRGPQIKLKLVPAGEVASDIENVFVSAGINQTRHQIMLNVRVGISILLPVSQVYDEVITAVCVAETVIVGEVPGTYANLDGLMQGITK